MAEDIRLILFGPTLIVCAVQACFGIAAEFAHDQRLLIVDAPLGLVGGLGMTFIPADILIRSDYIQRVTKWIVDYLGVASARAPARRR